MKKHIFLFFMALFFLFCFLFGFQKQKELTQPEKHEVEVRLVLVDVIVKKGGEFVTDLKKEDFELYEDGMKVPINSFELISSEGDNVNLFHPTGDKLHGGLEGERPTALQVPVAASAAAACGQLRAVLSVRPGPPRRRRPADPP